jgi:PAS domain S-box-containing protein
MSSAPIKSRSTTVDIVVTLLLGAGAPLLFAIGVGLTVDDLTLKNEPLHALIEISGGAMAIGVALLLSLRLHDNTAPRHFVWACAALVSMGIMDAIHGALPFGLAWSWTRHIATLIGGILFAGVWIRVSSDTARNHRSFLIVPAILSVVLATLIWQFPEGLPMPWTAEGYTLWPKVWNAVGGLGFLLATVFLFRQYARHREQDDLVFAGHTLLFGVAGLLFSFSHAWGMEWWLWHSFRLIAYLIVVRSGYHIVARLNHALVGQQETLINEVERRTQALRESESHKAAIFNTSLDAIITMDYNGRVTDFNPAAETVFGYPHAYALGKTVAELVIPQRLRQRHHEGLSRYLATGEGPVVGKRIEVPALHADGHEFPAELSISRIPGSEPPVFTATLRDVTSRKEAERALRESEARLRLAQKSGRIGVFDWSMRDNRVIWTPELEALFDLAEGTFENSFEGWRKRVRPEDADRVIKQIDVAMAEQRTEVSFEFRRILPDGSQRWTDAQARFDYDNNGKPLRMIGVNIDIDDKKQAEDAMRQSEALLRLFIEHAPSAIAMFDRQMRYIAISNRWRQDYNLEEEIVGRSYYEIFSNVPEQWRNAHRRALTGEVLRSEEDRFWRPDGTHQWVKWEMRPWFANGEIGGILIATENVTAQVQAKHALTEREAVLRAVTNEAGVGLVLIDKHRRYLFANQTYAKILHLSDSNIVGKHIRDVLNDVYDQIEPKLELAFRGERVTYELRRPTFTGAEERFYEVVYEPRHEPSGDAYVVVVIVDITERRKAQENLERTVAERTAALRESNEQMEAFSYTIAHDLRGPLRAQQGFATALLEDFNDALGNTGREYCHRIIQAAARLNDLVNDLLTYSRLARSQINVERVNLRDLVLQIVHELNFQIIDAKARVQVEDFSFSVCGHILTLRTSIENLISNALKFRKPKIAPSIRIWAEAREGFVRLWVEDNGIGIAPAYHHQIFGIFNRLHKPAEYPGTGVGLAIVQKGIERMGGQVGLESEAGKGSRFWIELEMPEE